MLSVTVETSLIGTLTRRTDHPSFPLIVAPPLPWGMLAPTFGGGHTRHVRLRTDVKVRSS